MIPIVVIQGAQYGSEGKGQIAAYFCSLRNIDFAVRTGAINAGHTVYFRGKPYKMQQLPTGWVNPHTKLVIGPGAYIHIPTLQREVQMVAEATGEDVRQRLYIDSRCSVHGELNEQVAQRWDRHHLIGATGKGCAEAITDKITNRLRGHYLFAETGVAAEYQLIDVPDMLTSYYHSGKQILIEGTQGALLDLHQGPYPYVTSRMTSAANWVAEAGLSPALKYEVILVARTFPIRVAGNSGPLPEETSWPEMVRGWSKGSEYEEAITKFEDAVRYSAELGGFTLPEGSDGLDQHKWSPQDRFTHRDTLSELNAMALRELQFGEPAAYDLLRPVLEFTTVTNKLRRIAHLDIPTLAAVVKREQPARMVLTFLNYLWPKMWGDTSLPTEDRLVVRDYLARLSKDLGGVNIDYVTTGPLPEHVVMV